VGKGYTAGYADLYDRMQLGGSGGSLTALEKAKAFKVRLLGLYGQIGAPTDLLRWKVGGESIEFLTDLTLAQRKANLELNPVPFERQAVAHVLAAAMGITGEDYAGL
jgi:alcohol dehydrogenase class IV